MEQIKNIIFDVGDVLLSYRWKYMLMDYGLSEEEAVRIGTEMFDDMIEDIRMDVVKILLNIRKKEGPIERTETTKVTGASLEDTAINLVDGNISEKEGGMNKTVVNESPKIGRNDPCICRKWKKI